MELGGFLYAVGGMDSPRAGFWGAPLNTGQVRSGQAGGEGESQPLSQPTIIFPIIRMIRVQRKFLDEIFGNLEGIFLKEICSSLWRFLGEFIISGFSNLQVLF